jgi:hypothetical protein
LVDEAGNAVVGTAAPPQATSVYPADGASRVAADTNVHAAFSEPMDEATTAGAFSLTDDTTGQPVAGSVVWFGNEVPIFVPSGGYLHPGDRFTATISTRARAADGINLAAPVSWSFAVSPDPIVVAMSPSAGASGVYPNSSVIVVFSQPMDEIAAQAAFSLTGPGGQSVPGSFRWFGPSALIFTPSSDLAPGAKYRARIDRYAIDQFGNRLATPTSWSFTTTAQPVIDAISPPAGSTNVSRTAPVIVVFSQAMDARSTAAAFSLKNSATGASVSGSVVWFGPSALIFEPASSLAASTGYTASLGAGARSQSGRALANPMSWSFATGGAAGAGAADVRLSSTAVATMAGHSRHARRHTPPRHHLPGLPHTRPLSTRLKHLQHQLRHRHARVP